MNRQFPCILKGFYTYFVFDKGSAISLDENCIANIDEINFNDKVFKNITAEYLANTYGEVKSKEHAEFIVKLCVKHGIEVKFKSDNEIKSFIVQSGALTLSAIEVKDLDDRSIKQITTPLPPECEGVDEWPKVGSSVEWGHTGKGEVKSLSDGFAWVKLDNKDYTTVYVSSLRKPKTPEQELEYNLTDLIMRARDADVDDVTIARSILSKYNITKKGEGDES